jgi:DNA-binding YbaB/EbfC family protein
MSFDMNKLMKQAAEMQKQIEEAQAAAKNEVVEGTAGGGMVTVRATGEGRLLDISIAAEAIDPDDKEGLEDLVLAAVNNALENAENAMKSKMGGLMGGLGLPGT